MCSFDSFFYTYILTLNTYLLKLFSINDERREGKKGGKSAFGFVECSLNRIIELSPSSGMKFLAVLQPLHISIGICHLDGQLDFMAFCHLIGRVQLSQEG